MGSHILPASSGRLFRLALGSVLMLAGGALWLVQLLAWLNVEPRVLSALEGGAVCALGAAVVWLGIAGVRRALHLAGGDRKVAADSKGGLRGPSDVGGGDS